MAAAPALRLAALDDWAAVGPAYLRHGDCVRLEVFDDTGQSIVGAIDQRVRVAGR